MPDKPRESIKTRKVVFHLGVGYAGTDREETCEYPADTTDDELEQFLKEWAWNYIDISFWDVEEVPDAKP